MTITSTLHLGKTKSYTPLAEPKSAEGMGLSPLKKSQEPTQGSAGAAAVKESQHRVLWLEMTDMASIEVDTE